MTKILVLWGPRISHILSKYTVAGWTFELLKADTSGTAKDIATRPSSIAENFPGMYDVRVGGTLTCGVLGDLHFDAFDGCRSWDSRISCEGLTDKLVMFARIEGG